MSGDSLQPGVGMEDRLGWVAAAVTALGAVYVSVRNNQHTRTREANEDKQKEYDALFTRQEERFDQMSRDMAQLKADNARELAQVKADHAREMAAAQARELAAREAHGRCERKYDRAIARIEYHEAVMEQAGLKFRKWVDPDDSGTHAPLKPEAPQ